VYVGYVLIGDMQIPARTGMHGMLMEISCCRKSAIKVDHKQIFLFGEMGLDFGKVLVFPAEEKRK
jgi:hypothetical protein